jgi:hypothetical protein
MPKKTPTLILFYFDSSGKNRQFEAGDCEAQSGASYKPHPADLLFFYC